MDGMITVEMPWPKEGTTLGGVLGKEITHEGKIFYVGAIAYAREENLRFLPDFKQYSHCLKHRCPNGDLMLWLLARK